MSATLAGLPCRDHALKRKTGTVPRNAARHSTGPCGPWTECRHGQARAKAGWAAYAQPRGPPPIRCAGNWRALRPCHNGTATRQQRYQPDAEACATDSQLVYSVLPVPEPAPFFRELQASELVSRNFIAWPLPAAGHRSPQAGDGVFRSRHGAKKTVAGVIRVDMPANEMRALRCPICRVRGGADLLEIGTRVVGLLQQAMRGVCCHRAFTMQGPCHTNKCQQSRL